MKYAERKINNLVNALNNAPPPPNYPDCTHCDMREVADTR